MYKINEKYWSFFFGEWGVVKNTSFGNEYAFEYPLLLEFSNDKTMAYTSDGKKFKYEKEDLFSQEIIIPKEIIIKEISKGDKVWVFASRRYGVVTFLNDIFIRVTLDQSEALVASLEIDIKIETYQREIFKEEIELPSRKSNNWIFG